MSTGAASTQSARQQRKLTPAQMRIKNWIKKNHGVLSETAREFGLSVQFVQRVAYNQEAQSKGLRVEHKLRSKGCPLIQKIG